MVKLNIKEFLQLFKDLNHKIQLSLKDLVKASLAVNIQDLEKI